MNVAIRAVRTFACSAVALIGIVTPAGIGLSFALSDLGNSDAVIGLILGVVGVGPLILGVMTWIARRKTGRSRLDAYWDACMYASALGLILLGALYVFVATVLNLH
jgi:hypothetical protein